MATSTFKTKEVPLQINRFTISTTPDNLLGKGAFGIVNRTRSLEIKTAAAKTINTKIHSRILAHDFDRLTRLRHPNVVWTFKVSEEDTIMWMFMELCSLWDLNEFIMERDVNRQQKIVIMSGITKGIDYLHANNVIHRDIKPGNILMVSDSPLVPKLPEFDLTNLWTQIMKHQS